MNPIRIILCLPLVAAATPAQWLERTLTTIPPSRSEPGMTFDFGRNKVVLFGGGSVTGPLALRNDTWTYDGTDWTQEAPSTSPAGRFGISLVHDLVRNVVVMYGGMTSMISIARPVAETWEWDGTNWTQITTATTPPGLTAYGLAYDSARARTVLYGGSSNPGLLMDSNQTWEYDGTDWTRITPATNPGPLERPAMCYFAALGRIVLFGGINVQTGGTDVTWSYDGTNWSQLPITGFRPSVRTFPKMVYDPVRQVSVLYGGMDPTNGNPINDTWEFDGVQWTHFNLLNLPLPPARRSHALAFDAVRRRVVLHGGVTSNFQPLTDTHEYGASYERLGDGCAGSNGVPVLASTSVPRLGAAFPVTLGNLANGAVVGGVIAGLSSTLSGFGPLPFDLTVFGMPGCWLRVSPDITLFGVVGGGVVTVNLTVPANQAFVGLELHQQGLSLDPGFNAGGMVASNAMTATVGH
jgi:hypothetical protein